MQNKSWQRALLAFAVLALLLVFVILAQIVLSPFVHGSPARSAQVSAGPYHCTLMLYSDPAQAGYYLPFAIVPQPGTRGPLTYSITALPGPGVEATQTRGDISQNAYAASGVTGSVSITVRGTWILQLGISGPEGGGQAMILIVATAPPAIPFWAGWLIGLIPLCGFLLFLFVQVRQDRRRVPRGMKVLV